jgi:hypothetical protein
MDNPMPDDINVRQILNYLSFSGVEAGKEFREYPLAIVVRKMLNKFLTITLGFALGNIWFVEPVDRP